MLEMDNTQNVEHATQDVAHVEHGHAHHDHDDHEHHDTFISKYIFSQDHKMIAKQFLIRASLL